MAGVHSLHDAVEKTYLVRSVPSLFAALSGICIYRGMLKHYGRLFALAGISVFCTSIVYVEFAVQVRGYSLRILITVLQLFALLNVVRKEHSRRGVVFLFFIEWTEPALFAQQYLPVACNAVFLLSSFRQTRSSSFVL